jgi:hypothetical protein
MYRERRAEGKCVGEEVRDEQVISTFTDGEEVIHT